MAGSLLTWSSNADGDFDIYVWDRDTNTTHQFDLPGVANATLRFRRMADTSLSKAMKPALNTTSTVAENPLHDDFIM